MVTVKDELTSFYDITDYFYWTDILIAFTWINNNNKEGKTFAQNRAIEIRKLSNFGVYKLITATQNPADKSYIRTDLCFSELCSHEPKFLNLPET